MMPPTKIFVGRLPNNCKSVELRRLFERYGEVTECDVLGSYGFVHMKTEQMATEAIANLNNYELHDSRISVEQSTGKKGSGRGRGGGGPMRGRGGMGRGGMGGGYGMGGMGRPSPYSRYGGGGMNMEDRYPPPMDRRPLPPMPSRNGYYDEYDRRDSYRDYDYDRRGPLPMDRRPLPPPRDSFGMPLGRRSPPSFYDRRDAYGGGDMYNRRTPPMSSYNSYDRMPPRGGSPPRRFAPPLSRDLPYHPY